MPLRFFARLFFLLVLVLPSCSNDAAVAPSSADAKAPAPGAGAFGQGCTATEQCASSLCVRVDPSRGVCTRSCAVDADCPAAPNWKCVQPSDLSHPICACVTAPAGAACFDGVDADCNGMPDACQTCNGASVSVNDHDNCGACGVACGADQTCTGGQCTCTMAGATACGASCTDTSRDTKNCGACGNACGGDLSCVAGVCSCTDTTRPNACGSTCTNVATDNANCGACGTACPHVMTCNQGVCTCPAGTPTRCSDACVDVQTDRANCGACGAACGFTQVCEAGKCACPANETLCNGVCTNTASDFANCGACGAACGTGQQCTSAHCTCTAAGTTACGTTCARLAQDPLNCGACGNACGAEESCVASVCTCTSGVVCGGACKNANDAQNCGACGVVCPQGQLCNGGACTCTGAGLTTCGASCFNTLTDPAHCGGCGIACPATEQCNAGACACAAGTTYCAGPGCVNTSTDATNCGACANACPPTEVCSGGHCGCPTYGQMFCPAQNACIDTLANATNCGSCGHVCPATATCSYGSCLCNQAGFTVCGSACVNEQTDASNCGSCGNVCGGILVCTAGLCRCPSPVSAAAVRETSSVSDTSKAPRVASNGSLAAVVYNVITPPTTPFGSNTYNVRVAILNADGTRAVPSDIALTNFPVNSTSSGLARDILWTGTSWAVVWLTDLHIMFQQLAANGVPQGSLADITALTTGTAAPALPAGSTRLAYASGQGFAIVSSTINSTVFQSLGTDGAHPQGIITIATDTYGIQTSAIAGAPGAGWGVLVGSGAGGITLHPVNADGSVTAVPTKLTATGYAPTIAYDGITWVAAWKDFRNPPYPAVEAKVLARGPTLSTRVDVLVSPASPTNPPPGNVALAVSGADISLAWETTLSANTPGPAQLARFRAPVDPNGALTTLTDPTALVTTSTIDPGTLQATATGATTLLSVWADTRWGHDEIYAQATDFLSCQ